MPQRGAGARLPLRRARARRAATPRTAALEVRGSLLSHREMRALTRCGSPGLSRQSPVLPKRHSAVAPYRVWGHGSVGSHPFLARLPQSGGDGWKHAAHTRPAAALTELPFLGMWRLLKGKKIEASWRKLCPMACCVMTCLSESDFCGKPLGIPQMCRSVCQGRSSEFLFLSRHY